jgi:hypothetical protein
VVFDAKTDPGGTNDIQCIDPYTGKRFGDPVLLPFYADTDRGVVKAYVRRPGQTTSGAGGVVTVLRDRSGMVVETVRGRAFNIVDKNTGAVLYAYRPPSIEVEDLRT